jgi:hypothetical protein
MILSIIQVRMGSYLLFIMAVPRPREMRTNAKADTKKEKMLTGVLLAYRCIT